MPEDVELDTPHPLEFRDNRVLTRQESDKLARFRVEHEKRRREVEVIRREKGLDRALKLGLIEGISFALIGAAVWAAHVGGRRWLETPQEQEEPINRIYLILLAVIFGVITIVNLPQAVFEGFRYAILDPLDGFGRQYQPGGKLSLSIAALPIWIIYLVGAIRAARRGGPRVIGHPILWWASGLVRKMQRLGLLEENKSRGNCLASRRVLS